MSNTSLDSFRTQPLNMSIQNLSLYIILAGIVVSSIHLSCNVMSQASNRFRDRAAASVEIETAMKNSMSGFQRDDRGGSGERGFLL